MSGAYSLLEKKFFRLGFLAVVFLVGFALRLYASTFSPFFISEQGRDLLVAKHLANIKTFNTTISPHSSWRLLPHSVIYFNFLALLYKLFPDIFLIRYIYAFLSTFIIFIAYKIGMLYRGYLCALSLSLIFATSVIILRYGSDITGHAFVPLFVGISIWSIFSITKNNSVLKNSMFLLLSVVVNFIGILFSTSMLSIYPFLILIWMIYIYKYLVNLNVKIFFVLLIVFSIYLFLLISGINLFQIPIMYDEITNAPIKLTRIERFKENFMLFISTAQPEAIHIIGIVGSIIILFYKKYRAIQKYLFILFGLVITGILSTTYSPVDIYYLQHFFSALYFPYILFLSMSMFEVRYKYTNYLVISITVIFVIASFTTLYKQASDQYSINDADKLVEALAKTSYVKLHLPFQIVLPFMYGISDWLAPNYWYVLEVKLGLNFVQIVPENISESNIYISESNNRIVLICPDNENDDYYSLNQCLKAWKNKYTYPIKYVSVVNTSEVQYYIYETII